MYQLVNVYKPVGVTPGQLIQQFRATHTQYAKSKIGYAGRLDPLAHGVMLLMIDEATKKRDTYLHLPKIYECEALFGIETDTYDVLGQVKEYQGKLLNKTKIKKQIETFIHSKLGQQLQQYPPYSSKTVQGKPLHWWARNKKLSEITLPNRKIEIFSFKMLNTGSISAEKLKKDIHKKIASVKGDFRQKEIGERWKYFLQRTK